MTNLYEIAISTLDEPEFKWSYVVADTIEEALKKLRNVIRGKIIIEQVVLKNGTRTNSSELIL